MSKYFRAKIIGNIPLNKNHNLMSLTALNNMDKPLPGQFFMLQVSRGYDPLLKRAFSLLKKTPDGFQILYRIKGKGTSILSNLKDGEIIDVLGPLGNHYPIPDNNQIPLVIAGGIGIASVFSLIEKLSERSYVFYGARSRDELFMLDELKKISKELVITTDDGSFGIKGNIVGAFDDFLTRHSPASLSEAGRAEPGTQQLIYACGPRAMIKEIAHVADANKIKAFVSLEENMACGIGACLGCAVKTVADYKMVCKEGPVFDAEEIVW